MVDVFEDMWLFISAQKVELTDFQNLEGEKKKILVQSHLKITVKKKSSY